MTSKSEDSTSPKANYYIKSYFQYKHEPFDHNGESTKLHQSHFWNYIFAFVTILYRIISHLCIYLLEESVLWSVWNMGSLKIFLTYVLYSNVAVAYSWFGLHMSKQLNSDCCFSFLFSWKRNSTVACLEHDGMLDIFRETLLQISFPQSSVVMISFSNALAFSSKNSTKLTRLSKSSFLTDSQLIWTIFKLLDRQWKRCIFELQWFSSFSGY